MGAQLHIIDDTDLAGDVRLTPRYSSTVTGGDREAIATANRKAGLNRPEVREKISAGLKTAWSDPEYREKQRTRRHGGGKRSPEMIEKMRATASRPDVKEKNRLKSIAGRRAAESAPRYSSTDEQIKEIDRQRVERGLTVEAFCALAKVSFWTWRDIRRGTFTPSHKMLKRLKAALVDPATAAPPVEIIKSYHRLIMRLLAQDKGLDADAVIAVDLSVQRPQVPVWLEAARINNMAIYLTTVELQLENADLARALGVSREAVRKARNKVEDLRDDAAIDALLDKVAQQVRG